VCLAKTSYTCKMNDLAESWIRAFSDMIPAMIASLRHFLGWLVSAFRSREDLVLENLALHQQKFALRVKERFNSFILSETRWPAPSLCRGNVDSRAVFLRAKFFFETRPGTVHALCEHFRGSTNQHAIPNRRTSAKEKEILLMWCTTIWRTTGLPAANSQID
jgi:hypothetical protein